jgi:hypothetical protein
MSYFPLTSATRLNWVTARTIDFTAQATQTLSTDTTYTIDTLTWTKGNSTNDNSAMVLTNGTGVVITPKSTSDYNGGTKSAPYLSTPLSGIISGLELSWGVRVSFYWSSQNATANYDSSISAIDTTAVSGSAYGFKRGFTVSGQGISHWLNDASSNASGFKDTTMTMAASNNVAVLEIPTLGLGICRAYYGQYSSGFPAISACTPLKGIIVTQTVGWTPSTANVTIGAQRAGSGTAYVATCAAIKVEYMAK